ncbi:PIN2/TERF1-interacting telomerase inhibitor 1, variant 2 [Clonorchis sinensis]|uniref:PIN2/TERF1-interacting telomerase inhibitor 1, variant 2 n=1 Tax=Clonorchis sinensis TaxID=79923 RepID=A0A8T1MBL6_CLOSI|nr:PIN2/TERF1-interacting telomerase inhibitor 1, variant 2 [Clonorchis sinensis]
MLSEPRKKVRYSTNPNGSLWVNDTAGFGRQMLERLGWTPGSGLGKREDGIPKPLKPHGQKGREGLGKKIDYQLGGSKQLDDYAQLLKELNSSYESKKRSNSSTSLEDLSKSSSNRLHYPKFVRAKDASRYDEKSLAIILGLKPAESKQQSTPKPTEPPNDFGVKTVSSSLSINDYFKKRRAELQESRLQTHDKSTLHNPDPQNETGTSRKRKTSELEQSPLPKNPRNECSAGVSLDANNRESSVGTPSDEGDPAQSRLPADSNETNGSNTTRRTKNVPTKSE